MKAELVGTDKADFERLESVIQKGLDTFVEVGAALMEIKERGLYKASFSTFEAYVQIRWKMSRQHAYRQIAAAETVALLSPHGDTERLRMPSTEAHVRPLTTLPQSERFDAWREAVQGSGGNEPTPAAVRAVVDKRRDLPKVARPSKAEKPEDAAAAIVASAKREPETPRPDLAPKRRPTIMHLMNVIDAATSLTGDTSEEEIAAIPFNDLMGQRLRVARELIDRVLAFHSDKEKLA